MNYLKVTDFKNRFISPAIMSPVNYRLLEEKEMTEEAAAEFLAISKLIQLIASGVAPKKDKFLIPFEPLVKKYIDKVKKYELEIAVIHIFHLVNILEIPK